MLVLSRKQGESVVIGNITLTVVEVQGNRVRLAFDAPGHVRILRSELIAEQNQFVLTDPDLLNKPSEWKDADFCSVRGSLEGRPATPAKPTASCRR